MTPPGCSKRSSSPAAWCSPATSADGSLTADAHAGSSAARRRCAPPAERYLAWLLAGRERARRIGERPLTDHTIEQRLAVLAQFATHLDRARRQRLGDVLARHIEAFLATGRDRGFRLAALRDFFRFARKERICLTDPTAGLAHRPARGFRGRTLSQSRPGQAPAPLGGR